MATSGCEKPKCGQLWYQTRGLSSKVHKPMADMGDLNLRITTSVLVFQHLLSISYINRSCFIIVARHFSNSSESDGFMTGLKIRDKPDIKMCHLNLMTSFSLRLKKKKKDKPLTYQLCVDQTTGLDSPISSWPIFTVCFGCSLRFIVSARGCHECVIYVGPHVDWSWGFGLSQLFIMSTCFHCAVYKEKKIVVDLYILRTQHPHGEISIV